MAIVSSRRIAIDEEHALPRCVSHMKLDCCKKGRPTAPGHRHRQVKRALGHALQDGLDVMLHIWLADTWQHKRLAQDWISRAMNAREICKGRCGLKRKSSS
eukprot:3040577-Amphidinium_carterae.3